VSASPIQIPAAALVAVMMLLLMLPVLFVYATIARRAGIVSSN